MEKLLALVAKNRRIAYPIAGLVLLLGLSAGALAESGTLTTTPTGTADTSASTAATTPPGGNGNGVQGFPAAGGGDNIVQVINRTDNSVKSHGRDQVKVIRGPNVGPKNEAFAFASCVNCTTVAVAIQIDLRNANADNVQPSNFAGAINFQCSGCTTCAFAIQDVIPVSDPDNIPNDIRQTANQIDAELRDLPTSAQNAGYSNDCPGMNAFVDNVFIAQLNQLAGALDVKRDTETAATTPGATPMDSPAASATPTASASPTDSPTPQPSPSGSP